MDLLQAMQSHAKHSAGQKELPSQTLAPPPLQPKALLASYSDGGGNAPCSDNMCILLTMGQCLTDNHLSRELSGLSADSDGLDRSGLSCQIRDIRGIITLRQFLRDK